MSDEGQWGKRAGCRGRDKGLDAQAEEIVRAHQRENPLVDRQAVAPQLLGDAAWHSIARVSPTTTILAPLMKLMPVRAPSTPSPSPVRNAELARGSRLRDHSRSIPL